MDDILLMLLISGPNECTSKPSSLPHKVIERQHEIETWKKVLLFHTLSPCN